MVAVEVEGFTAEKLMEELGISRETAMMFLDVMETHKAIEELEKEIDATVDRINELIGKEVKGWVEYKYVLNKVKKPYWYWYWRYREDGKTRSKYLGKRVPEWLIEGFRARDLLKMLNKKLNKLLRLHREAQNYLAEGHKNIRFAEIVAKTLR